MNNLLKLITVVSLLTVISFSSTASLAKNSKNTPVKSTNRSFTNSNSQNNQQTKDWKIGADFGMTLDKRTTTITGTNDPLLQMLGSMNGFSPFFNIYADYSISENIGIQAKVGWDYTNISASTNMAPNGLNLRVTTGGQIGTIGIGASIRYDVSKNIFLTAGPRLHFALGTPTITHDYKILTPGAKFDNGTQDLHSESAGSNTSTSEFGLEISGGYRIKLSNAIDLVPRTTFQFFPSMGKESSLGGGAQASTMTATRFQFSCGLMIGL